ncbi:MAG: isocitrate/isopropylmalate family dehydrogenase [Rickettsiales bacterium]
MTPMKKIVASSKEPIVVLHGDEMAQVAFERILDVLVRPYVDMEIIERDLSARNRILTQGAVVAHAIEDLKKHKIGVKNAGITVNAEQKRAIYDALQQEGAKLPPVDSLPAAAVKSPNGAIRKGLGGNISREEIPFANIQKRIPEWKGRDVRVSHPLSSGMRAAFSCASPASGMATLEHINASGETRSLHSRPVGEGDPLLLATACADELARWAAHFFETALELKKNAYVALKDTVVPGYDGVMRAIIDDIFKEKFAERFREAGIFYRYGLIDAQAADMIISPPASALWGLPENEAGANFSALVELLKKDGFPDRGQHISVSRMSAGGGDQYNGYNAKAEEKGVIRLRVNDKILHSVPVSAGDPVMFMSNERAAIAAFVRRAFADAKEANEEIYFGFDEGGSEYDKVFAAVVREVYADLLRCCPERPPYMLCSAGFLLQKMIADPPKRARYALRNLDGDVFSDISAAYGGSLAMASSAIIGEDGACLYEAPHGTAPGLYELYKKSGGKEAPFNPSALIFAFAEALRKRGERDRNSSLSRFGETLRDALIKVTDEGNVTPDVASCLRPGVPKRVVNLFECISAVENEIDARYACRVG